MNKYLNAQWRSGIQLPNKSRHLNELTHEPVIWSCDTGQWLSCFDSCQLTKLWMSDVKDVNLPRHAWDTPPFLLLVSPTLPVQSLDEYVRTYVRSVSHVTTKRKDVDHILSVWGSLPRALCARGSPTIRSCNLQKNVLFYCQTCQLSRFCLDSHDFFHFSHSFTTLQISHFFGKYFSEMKCYLVE